MKGFILLLLFSILRVDSLSQEKADILSGILEQTAKRLPADQVFLHIDRNLYHPGDTIRFQAYIKDRQTGIFETKSLSLYSILVNSSHTTIDSARFRIINSTASGWLKIPDLIPFGDYALISFTSCMMNFSPSYIFSAPVRIDRIMPIQANFYSNSPNNNSLSYQAPLQQPIIDLRFLPEGGSFIYGVEQRLAFNAVNSFGRTIEIKGEIINQKGIKIIDFKSGKYGPGIIEFTPILGDTYYAVLNGKDFSGIKWPLPVPQLKGVVLKVHGREDGLIDIDILGKEVSGQTYHLVLVMNNVLVFSKEILLDSLFSFKIRTEQLPLGTAYITLFDNDQHPVAERLVFINSQRKLNIEIHSLAKQYSPGDETELTINTIDNEGNNVSSILSVAVIDSISGYNSSLPLKDIESSLLFEKEFYENLPSKLRLNGLRNIDNKDIDLFLMTYGWRKFRSRDSLDNEIVREIKDYDCLKIKSTATTKKARNEINIMTIEGSEMYTLKPYKNESVLKFDTLRPTVRQLMIVPEKNANLNVDPVIVEFPENRIFTEKAKSVKYDFSNIIYPYIDFPLRMKTETDFGPDSAIMIEPVIIKGSKVNSKKIINKYQIQYQNANTITLTNRDFNTSIYFEDIILKLHPFKLDTKSKKVYLTVGRSGRYSPPALIVVDDIPLWSQVDPRSGKWESGYETISDMAASNISSITMIRGVQGFTFYGEAALGGVIFVTTNGQAMMEGTYQEVKPYRTPVKNDLAKPIRIFRSEIEYYVPKKEEVRFNPEFQYRSTLFWKNELILDGTKPMKIKFPNNMVKGTILIIINGVSFTNIPFSLITKFSIN